MKACAALLKFGGKIGKSIEINTHFRAFAEWEFHLASVRQGEQHHLNLHCQLRTTSLHQDADHQQIVPAVARVGTAVVVATGDGQ